MVWTRQSRQIDESKIERDLCFVCSSNTTFGPSPQYKRPPYSQGVKIAQTDIPTDNYLEFLEDSAIEDAGQLSSVRSSGLKHSNSRHRILSLSLVSIMVCLQSSTPRSRLDVSSAVARSSFISALFQAIFTRCTIWLLWVYFAEVVSSQRNIGLHPLR